MKPLCLVVVVFWMLIFLKFGDRVVLGHKNKGKGKDKDKDKDKNKGRNDDDVDIISHLPGDQNKDWKPILDLLRKLNSQSESTELQIQNHEKIIKLLQNSKGKDPDNKLLKEEIAKLKRELELLREAGNRPNEGQPDRKFKMDADNQLYLYFDGKQIKDELDSVSWKTTISASLPSKTQVIAVKGINTYGDPGILGSTEDGFVVTNSSWKCSNVFSAKWNLLKFDDSRWPHAYEVLEYSDKQVKGIHQRANWIWTRIDYGQGKGDRVVYCRFRL